MSEIVEVKRGRGAPRKYPFPAQLVCTVTGKTVKTNPVQFQALMTRSNQTMEQVIATFVSREGKRKLKADAEAAKTASTPATDVPATA